MKATELVNVLGVTWAELVAAQGPNPQAGLDVPEQRARLDEVIARQFRISEAKPRSSRGDRVVRQHDNEAPTSVDVSKQVGMVGVSLMKR